MSLRLRILSSAHTDIAAAFVYYESESTGLGELFVSSLDTVFEHILEFPLLYPTRIGNLRRALLTKFPYAIYYMVDPNEIVVIGVRNTKQDPASLPTAN